MELPIELQIQCRTFCSWLNYRLNPIKIEHLQKDLSNGVNLLTLLERLQKRKYSNKHSNPSSSKESFENVEIVLQALVNENIKLVNITPNDIVNGDLRAIQSLLWQLIVRYELESATSPPKRLLLSWLEAALPELNITNFTKDWNSGLALSALVEFCQPGLFPAWRKLNPKYSSQNLRQAMLLAHDNFGIPSLIDPEDFADPDLDEKSTLCYLSFFFKDNGPAYRIISEWVKNVLGPEMANFQNLNCDWNSGILFVALIDKLGGTTVGGYRSLNADPKFWEHNMVMAIHSGKTLGVEPPCQLKAKHFIDPKIETIAVMTYLTRLLQVGRDRKSTFRVSGRNLNNVFVNKEAIFDLELLRDGIELECIRSEVHSSSGKLVTSEITVNKFGGSGKFTPFEPGVHDLKIFYRDELAVLPMKINVQSDLGNVIFSGIEPCSVGSLVEVVINSNGAGSTDVNVVALSSTNRELPCQLIEKDGSLIANFIPDQIGEWRIAITYSNEHINGSPFPCLVYDSSKVFAFVPEMFLIGRENYFSIDCRKAGWGELKMKLECCKTSQNLQLKIDERGDGLYNVTVQPEVVGKYFLFVTFNEQTIKGSPFLIYADTSVLKSIPIHANTFQQQHQMPVKNGNSKLINSNGHDSNGKENLNANKIARNVRVFGEGLQLAQLGRTTFFELSGQIDLKLLALEIKDPTYKDVKFKVNQKTPGSFLVEFKPTIVGEHHIQILLDRVPVPGSPFKCLVFDVNRVKIFSPKEGGTAFQPIIYEIDSSESGFGAVEVFVNEGTVPCEVKPISQGLLSASFVPQAPGQYFVEITLNGIPLPSSPFKYDVGPGSAAKTIFNIETLENFKINEPIALDIHVTNGNFSKEDLSVEILDQNNGKIAHRIGKENDNFYKVYFRVPIVGNYSFNFFLKNSLIHSFVAKAYALDNIIISDIPHQSVVGQRCSFQVDASNAGEGQLEIAVNDGEVPNQVQVLGNGKCLISFVPELPSPHIVDIKFNNENVSGCPFMCEVDELPKLKYDLSLIELIQVGVLSTFKVVSNVILEPQLFLVKITSPNGAQIVPKLIHGKTTLVEFVVNEVGACLIEFFFNNKPILDKPIVIKSFDPAKVSVTPALSGQLNSPVQFVVDAVSAGEGNLEISVLNEQEKNVPTQVAPMGGAKFGVIFTPTTPNDHVVSITFNNVPVNDNPFIVSVLPSTDQPVITGPALQCIAVDQLAKLIVHNIDVDAELVAKVQDGNNQVVPVNMIKDAPNRCVHLDFSPRSPGEYRVQIKYRGEHVQKSPFTTKVYDIKKIKVKDVPSEIVVGKPVTFLVEATNAGPGNLEVIVNNGKVPSTPKSLGPSLYAITFVPVEHELHIVEIKFNGRNVENSPFKCSILDAEKVQVKRPEKVLINSIAQLSVQTNGGILNEESIIILGPSHSNLKATLTGDHLNGYQIQFNPTEVGDHAVDIKIAGISIPGCPFLVKVYDSKLVKVADINDGVVGKSVYFSIDASTAGAGNLEIIVSCNGRNVPNYVQSEGNAKFRVNFKPTEASQHQISCKFNGDPVPGSPFLLHVADSDSSLSSFIMDNVLKNVSVNRNIEFKIDNPGEEIKDCQMIITPPSGKKISAKVDRFEKLFMIQFKCTEVGPHQAVILLDGNAIAGSPFSCNVYDVNRIKVSGLVNGAVGVPYTFLVDASTAGEGTLELVVSTKTSSVRAEVLMRSRGMYDVTFTPLEAATHFLSMTFNEEEVPGTPMEIAVKQSALPLSDAASPSTTATQFGLVEQLTVINFRSNCSNLQSIIVGPQKSKIPGTITRLDADNFKLEFIPQEVGKHKIEILTPERPIWPKPLILEVCDPARIKIISPGICARSKECEISVDTLHAGNGELTAKIVDGNKHELPHVLHETSNRIYALKFTPTNDSTHRIELFYNKLAVLEKPLIVTVQPQMESIIIYGKGLKCGCPREKAIFFIETDELSANDFDIIVSEPNRSPLPVKCFQQKNGSLAVEWTPRVIGAHLIDVYHNGKPVIGSPFSCEVFDAKQVVIEPIESNNFVINKKINLKLLRINAGYAELDVTVTSPLGRHLPIEVNGMPDCEGELIEFVPTVPGKYRIAITFGGVEIPDSPLTFVAQESILPKVSGSGLFRGIINEPSVFTIDAKDIYGSPEIKIDAPETETSFTIEKCNDIYKICYIPREVGVFDITVLWNGQEIPNSPYHPHIVDPDKVRVIGGWENVLEADNRFQLCVGEEKKLSFDISDAGPGKMSAKVKNVSTGLLEELSLDQTTSTKYKLIFSPKEAGEYELLLYLESILLPRSPILAVVQDAGLDSGVSVVLRGPGLAGARVGEETEFVIDGKDAGDGEPEVSLTGIKSDIRIRLSVLGTRLYKANYIPKVPGSYLLNVHWRGKQVSGCPLKVTILPSCDAKRVHCTGEGLKHGTIGKEIKAFIDTRRAGPGELSAHCVGPSKAAICELYDQNDGTFTLLLHPQEGGKHTLNIKYGGQHVVGSPFTLRVFTAPDASKVKVIGPGVEHGVLPIFQSHFVCDTRGAGAGQLTVRIRGPKGAFRVEMQRESQKDRAIHCKYDPTEPGDYRIEIKWAGEHVPGSPFNVMIFDTQDELNRFVRGSGHNGNSINGSLVSLPPLNAIERSNGYGTYTSDMNWKGSIPDL